MSTNDSGYNRHDNISVNGVFAINGDGNRATEELLVDNVMLNGDSAATKEELLQGFLSLMTMVMKRIAMEDGGRVGHGIFLEYRTSTDCDINSNYHIKSHTMTMVM